ncbi:MAG: DUF4238 domain-containing protein [Nitrospira sp.]|nr:DUF4238 domain-containing protein [Nitrospira sp.]
MRSFCDDSGRVLVCRKDDPSKAIPLSPDNTAFHKYYYSQPTPEGGKDHNAFEDFFSKVEEKWPRIVDRLHRRENVNDSLETIFEFMALQRARVPASRDVTEKIHAEDVMTVARRLDAEGKLSPEPDGIKDILDHVEVAINPHQSLHGMVTVMQATGQVFDQIGFYTIHNKTSVSFLTSDNPGIWFDPSVQDTDLRPYVLRPDGPVVFIFPISPVIIIYGHSSWRDRFASEGLGTVDLSNTGLVEMINRQICRFGYRAIFAQKAGQERLIEEHASVSPTIRFDRIGMGKDEMVLFEMVFGKRERKPKWVEKSDN